MNKTICTLHDEIIKYADEISKIKTSHYDSIDDMKWDIDALADKIMSVAEKAKDAGSNMEYRLKDYYEAITGLGFERKKIEVKLI